MNFKKNLVLAVMVAASVVFGQTPWNGTVDTSWYDTRQTTFTITTAEQLAGLAELVNNRDIRFIRGSFEGKTVILGADIDLGGRNWTPIGMYYRNSIPGNRTGAGNGPGFWGIFDGNGYSISNLSIIRTDIDDHIALGLFGYVGRGGKIKNLNLEVKEIVVHNDDNSFEIILGGLAGAFHTNFPNTTANINIENVVVNIIDSIHLTAGRGNVAMGGLVGAFSSDFHATIFRIANSSVSGKISILSANNTRTCIGGLIGGSAYTNPGYSIASIVNSHFSGSIYAHYADVSHRSVIGGLIGSNELFANTVGGSAVTIELTISNSYSIANVFLTGITDSGTFPRIIYGGLTGGLSTNLNITNSYASGTISNTISGNTVATAGIIGMMRPDCTNMAFSSVYYNSAMTNRAIGHRNIGASIPCDIDTSGITALTSAQMRNRANFVGWDFHNVWSNLEGVTFPFLQGRTEKIVISLTANVASKIFDGNTAAQASNAQLIGTRQGSDIRIKEITANFSDRNPGINIPVFFDVVLEGNDAEWYEFVSSPLITATILPIPITVTLDPKTVNVTQNARIMPNIEKNLAFIGDIYNVPETEEASPVAEWSSFTVALPWFDDWAFRNSRFLVYDTIVIPETEFRIAVLNGYRRTQFSTDVIRDDELIEGTYAITFVPNRSTRYNITFDNQDLYFVVTDDGTFIRPRSQIDSRFGILSENAVVSDVARFSVITPEPAVANVRILDNLGNVVFSADDVGAYCIRPAMPNEHTIMNNVGDLGVCNTPLQNAIVWNLTNQSGRFVANGTYIIAVEATTISGKRYHYSTRIGVKR